MEGPRIRYTTTADGVSVAYWEHGEGSPLLLSLDDGICHGEALWRSPRMRDWLVRLGEGHRLIGYDPRGWGLSDRVPTGTVTERCLDVDAVLDAADVHATPVFASLHGCQTAIAFAATRPGRVEQLALWDPYPSGEALIETYQSSSPLMSIADQNFGVFLFSAYAVIVGETQADALGEVWTVAKKAWGEPIESERGLDTLEAIQSLAATEYLGQITAPTLVLHRAGNSYCPTPLARAVAAGIRGAEFRSMEGDSTYPFLGEVETGVLEARRFLFGRTSAAPATMMRTVMFTDLAGSTATTQRLGDEGAQNLVRAHNEIVRAALAAHDGHEIKHTGDGIFAWFPAASSGLDCAQAIQHGVADLANPDLGVKIGINAGEPIAEEDDLYGTAVQIAARVTDQAGPGEIVCTDVVRLLVAGKAYLFSEREPAALKGVEEPVRMFTVGGLG